MKYFYLLLCLVPLLINIVVSISTDRASTSKKNVVVRNLELLILMPNYIFINNYIRVRRRNISRLRIWH